MARRLLLGLTLVLVVVGPAAGDVIEKKRSVDSRIVALREKVAAAKEREESLRREIDAVSSQILSLEHRVGDVSQQLEPLERELRLRELKLNRLNGLFQVQSGRLAFLRAEYRTAVERLNRRLVTAYQTETPDELSFLLAARSFSDLLDGFDYIRAIADQDTQIVEEVASSKREVASARARTKVARDAMQAQAQVVAVRVRQVKELRDRLLSSQGKLAEARNRKRASLESLGKEEREAASQIDALLAVSAQLAARIRAAQARSSRTPVRLVSGAGFVWPVSAVITSPFGWRWGRMHEGIDLGAAYGVPIVAAASGTVIYAGWMGGYGNLVVIDHGGGLATAYGHQSQIAVAVGDEVEQGQTIGYVGSTGHSFGPHLHFEVRIDGLPVDPLGYL